MNKIKYYKILTSIFIILLFIFVCSPFSFATEEDYTEYFGGDFPSNFTQFLYDRLVENYSTQLNTYDYCIALCYEGYGSSSSNYGGFYVYFTNDSTLNFTSGTYNSSGYLMNFGSTNTSGEMVKVYISMGRPSYTSYSTDYKYTLYGFNHASNVPDGENISKRLHFYKGENNITLDNNVYLYKSVPSYDFSFVIKDNSTNTEHNFDFNLVEGSFNDGRSFIADDFVTGQYVVSVSSLVHNSYDIGNNEIKDTFFVTGYIDYIDYSDSSPKSLFYWSTGYNRLKILSESNNSLTCYRFQFKGYSSDSWCFEDIAEDSNIVQVRKSDYCNYEKYKYPKYCTFAYSNRDIYYGNDSSLYGFSGLSSNKFFNESTYTISSVDSITTNNYTSSSSSVENDITTYSLNNNVVTLPSSEVSLSSSSYRSYSNSEIKSDMYEYFENITGTEIVTEDTSNWGIFDYISRMPQLISNLPNMLLNGLFDLLLPSYKDIKPFIDSFNDLARNKLGVFYQAYSFIYNLFTDLQDKYESLETDNYVGSLTLPSLKWYNPITREKEVLVGPQIVNWSYYYNHDEDWKLLIDTLRTVNSVLIYFNLIIMLVNKARWILGAMPEGIRTDSVLSSASQLHREYKEYRWERWKSQHSGNLPMVRKE